MARPQESVVHGSAAPEAPAPRAQAKDLPSLDKLLKHPDLQAAVGEHGHSLVARLARTELDAARQQVLSTGLTPEAVTSDALAHRVAQALVCTLQPAMRAVINLTGTVIHTNLGRALLADEALQHLMAMMAGPNNLEFDLATGARGDRDSLVEDLLCQLTGAEAATVVNNNAAAVLLSMAALAGPQSPRREVIVSRGELVEIGGAFRMPDVMATAGATMVEVGTTNRTHLRDYASAIGPHTAMVMKVHTSNYAVQGFTASVSEAELAPLCREQGVLLVSDLGSGALVDLSRWGLPKEPLPQEMLAAGCDVVTFSGDKLLGGPQAGLIVGSKAAIGRIRKYPMKRALRMSKLPIAALEATLRLYLRPERLAQDLPTLRLLTRPLADIQAAAAQVQPALQAALSDAYQVEVVLMSGQIGSGSLPIERLPSAGLVIRPHAKKGVGRALDKLMRALRDCPRPIIGRVADDALWLDLRCLERPQDLRDQCVALQHQLQRA